MSIIHVNHIAAHVLKLFEGKIDVADVEHEAGGIDNYLLTRSLAAYAIHYLSQADAQRSANAVTDGAGDNGIDALYYDEVDRRLYMVQSKWIKNGKGEPSNADIKKFLGGVEDLINVRLNKFNKKILDKKSDIMTALDDPITKYSIVVVYTGLEGLAKPSRDDITELVAELNDPSEVVEATILKQNDLHKALTVGLSGEPIDIAVALKSWGRVQEPYPAYYGQVDASQIVDWWSKYHTRLFSKNLRSILGNTDINNEIKESIANTPELFWYYNNGITIVANEIVKSMAHGSDNDIGVFHCKNISIVNGAQTVGTIGRFAETPLSSVDHVLVPVRLISLQNSSEEFGKSVTRTNNRQNRIESRDFVALDPEQTRLRNELAFEEITYHVGRSDSFEATDKSFDLIESTIALACASGKGTLVMQLKREISRLWDDITKAPYRELFNADTCGLYVWRCVRIQRKIDCCLKSVHKHVEITSDDEGVQVHGNRIIAALVFADLNPSRFNNPDFLFDELLTSDRCQKLTSLYFERIRATIESKYSGTILQTLFKNPSKCQDLLETCRSGNQVSSIVRQTTLFDYDGGRV